ncbi:hypothetical protein HMI54_013054 [Coelomomyces lativittatus]|nr:hypothetical protein HMI54_013054 [Coelomomyces lativittatus]
MEEIEDEREILEPNEMEEEGPKINEIEESWESDEFYDFHSMDYETEESMEQEEVQFTNFEQEQDHKIAKKPVYYEREKFDRVLIPEKQRVSNAETIFLSDKEEMQEERRQVQEQGITRTYSEDLFLYFCTQQQHPLRIEPKPKEIIRIKQPTYIDKIRERLLNESTKPTRRYTSPGEK